MNFATICAQTTETPREVFVSATSTVMRCNVLLPPVGNKAPTLIELNIYGKAGERFSRIPQGSIIYIHGTKLRFDIETRTYSLHAGIVTQVTELFPIFNNVILSGRCVKDIQQDDARAFKTTADGIMICNQTLSVSTGKGQADLFNFYAINSVDDKLNQAELLANFTRKGIGLTINTRLVTDAWIDKETKERKQVTKLQLVSMTLAPKAREEGSRAPASAAPAAPAAEPTVPSAWSATSPSLWGGRSAVEEQAEPWGHNTGNHLPDLPGSDDDAPF
jgi:single-stranded DNA-binding protein